MGRYHLPSPYDPRRSNIIPTTAEHASAGDWAESSEPSAVERKNLYVLNLPLDMTNEEMLGLFQPFGTVVHACILAILDSSARRRGFILMGSGVEATAAMRNLHGQVYRCALNDFSLHLKPRLTPLTYLYLVTMCLTSHTRLFKKHRLRGTVASRLETLRAVI